MASLVYTPLSFATALNQNHPHHFPLKTHFSNLMFMPRSSIVKCPSTSFFDRRIVLRSNRNESGFVDENGVVDDMDGYMDALSLEYDSVWDTKPSWCQPWTITLTGVLVIAGSWVVLHSIAITAVVFTLIFAWWYIFLYSYPKAYAQMITERRKNVTSGVEDTFGNRKSQ